MHGLRGRIEVNGKSYNLEMPGFGRVLTDAEIAAVLSFVRASWGRVREPITPESVGRIRAATRERTDYWTVEELVRDP
jgi:mono/diheme cytochrome c family protein